MTELWTGEEEEARITKIQMFDGESRLVAKVVIMEDASGGVRF